MPIPAAIGAAMIGAGGSILGTGANAWSTGRQNRLSREWSERMYDKQFQDNLNFWQMQNEYNSPSQQMARLKGAGLNPALIYGGSSGGAAGTAGPINTPDVQSAQFRTPEFGSGIAEFGSYMAQIYDFEVKQAQVDNLKADQTVKYAQAANLAAGTDRSKFDLEFESELREVSAQARKESLRSIQARTKYTLDENERRMLANAKNLEEAGERILNYQLSRTKDKAEIERIKASKNDLIQSGQLKKIEKELLEFGISRNEPMFIKMLGRMLQTGGKGFMDKFGMMLDYLFSGK